MSDPKEVSSYHGLCPFGDSAGLILTAKVIAERSAPMTGEKFVEVQIPFPGSNLSTQDDPSN